jgi:hypothetical protein
MNEETKYPHFIQSKPCGIDKFEGQSQKRLTDAIVQHITSTDNNNNANCLPRIIGLEGGWGVGKSNVIKQIKEALKDRYYLFEYDAWGHQEDLQRRSFLEALTSTLINEELLAGLTTIKTKGGGIEKVSWEEKLKYLLARKTETKTEKYPRLSNSMVVSILFTIFTPLFIYFSSLATKLIKQEWLSSLVSFIVPLLPALAVLIIWLVAKVKNPNYKKIGFLLTVYSDKIENDICYETISEDEPTVTEFRNWMQDISCYFDDGKIQKLIIVFDNMDRLPAEKVKELWSSIHTFFSEGDFKNIWTIIPFDEKHLACAFGEPGEGAELAKFFINKTFPVVYRVTPPIITDSKKLFNELYEEAFAKTEQSDQEEINRIFRLDNPDATVRDIITFINHLVELKMIWKNEIKIFFMAVFALRREEIIKDPVNQILSGKYLGENLSKIILNNGFLQKNISALTYGILPNDAEQVPISKYVENCLKLDQKYDINKYVTHKYFLLVLENKIEEFEQELGVLINGLSKLNNEFEEKNKNIVVNLWDTIARQRLLIRIEKQEFDDTYGILLNHTSKQYQQDIIRYLCVEYQNYNNFHGGSYYNALTALETFVNNNHIENKINEYIGDIEKSPQIFFDYVSVAMERYAVYKLKTNPDELDDFFTDRMSNDIEYKNVLSILIANKAYKFDKTLQKLENILNKDRKFKIIDPENIVSAFENYKILSDKRPLPVQLNTEQRNILWSVFGSRTNTKEYLEILSMQLANGMSYSETLDEKQTEIIAKNLDYYAEYGTLLLNMLTWNSITLNQVLKYMTENKIGIALSLQEILPKFFEIKAKIKVTEDVLLDQLDRWSKYSSSIDSKNILTVIPNAKFFQHSVVTKNALTDYLNKTIIEALSDVSSNSLYNEIKNINSYWFIVVFQLIGTGFLKYLPDNLTDVGKTILDDIASGKQPVPKTDDLAQKIITKLDRKKTSAHIKVIRDKFCNSVYIMNVQLFKYIEPWFHQQGDLLSRSADVVHKIIEPVINDPDCLRIIISKPDYYAAIINSAGDDAIDIKGKIKEKLKTGKDDKFVEFTDKVILE